jgi:hypothetical protein
VGVSGSLLGRTLESSFHAFLGSLLQLIVHADVIFPDEVLKLLGFEVHNHGRALKILHEGVIIDAGQLLNEHLVKVVARLLLAPFVQEEKILDLPSVGGLVGEELLDDHHRRKEQSRHGEEREPILAKELHAVYLAGDGGGGNEFQNEAGLRRRSLNEMAVFMVR